MKVSLKTFGPAVAAGLVTLTSCNSVDDRARKYMANHTYSEFLEVTKNSSATLTQSKLDSVAYRDIFEGTKAAKDSVLIAEFNKIASNMRGYNPDDVSRARCNKIIECLTAKNITTKDMNDIIDKSTKCGEIAVIALQHYGDDWAYRDFFKKAGIMNDSIAAKCDKVSKQIAP